MTSKYPFITYQPYNGQELTESYEAVNGQKFIGFIKNDRIVLMLGEKGLIMRLIVAEYL